MNRKTFWTSGLAFVFLSILVLQAQQPTSRVIPFTIQTDLSPGTYQIRFDLFTAPVGGSSVFNETQTADVGDDGTFTLSLGNGTKEGLDPQIFVENPSLFLAVSGGMPPREVTGRIAVTTSAYSLFAPLAESATRADSADRATTADHATLANRATRADMAGRAATAVMADLATRAINADSATRASTAGRSDSAANADVATRATNADRASTAGRADSAATADRTGRLAAGAVGEGDVRIFGKFETASAQVNGRVGILTANPQVPLDVFGTGTFERNLITIGPATGLPGERVWLNYDARVAVARLTGVENVALGLGAGGTVDRVVIEPAGNVGIGTGNPRAKLDVNGTILGAMPLTAVAQANFRGILAAAVPSTNKIYVRVYETNLTFGMPDPANWTGWLDFGMPDPTSKIISVSASMVDTMNGLVTAIISARTTSGKVFQKMFQRNLSDPNNRLSIPAQWTAWIDFGNPGQ